MNLFRAILVLMTIAILSVTFIVGYNHGWSLIPIFFGEIASLTWSGQFNLDFTCYLILSALWLAWREHFTIQALALAGIASVAGIMFFAPYLIFLTYKCKGNMKLILIGESRI
ncbi:MAG: hypothetical protein MH321_13345 [Leptospiraceae bacterium]|nr:hypothetical protein [Leptospiraceae bacterium]